MSPNYAALTKIAILFKIYKFTIVMEKREIFLYAITILSFLAIVCILFVTISKNSNASDKKFMGLTGNIVEGLNNSFKVGDKLKGEIILNSEKESDIYGIALLTKDNNPLITETFNLREIPKTSIDSNQYSIKIEDLIDYTFKEKGNYELFLSILDLNINIKEEFVVE